MARQPLELDRRRRYTGSGLASAKDNCGSDNATLDTSAFPNEHATLVGLDRAERIDISWQNWDRLIRFIAAEDGKEYIGEPINPDLDVGAALAANVPVKVRLFNASSVLDLAATPLPQTLTAAQLLSPLTPHETGTIRCIGLNYRQHAHELNLPLPTHPTLFFKPPTSLGRPNAPLLIPHQATDGQADYEAELAVVLGRPCRNAVDAAAAMSCVLGYACANDVTARAHQFGDGGGQWGFGKGFDGFAPVGPCLVSAARRMPDGPGAVGLRTVLNGVVMQEARVDDMIFSVGEIVAFLSQGTTLEPGTTILTGTPCGIGMSRTPPVFLKPGDDLRICMSHGLGSLVNTVVYEDTPSS